MQLLCNAHFGQPASGDVLKTEVLTKTDNPSIWDRIGVIASALCLLHCAMTPLLIGYLTASGLGFLGQEIF
ncbi:MAG: MerC domain-containing protein, partial [Bradymonadaceae bacterium]